MIYKNRLLKDLPNEFWIPISGYESMYVVSNMGRIKSLKRLAIHWRGGLKTVNEKILNQDIRKGYCQVGLCKNGKASTIPVHRIVAEEWIPNPEDKPDVNHKKGIKTDNRVTELEWLTKVEHEAHTIEMGLKLSGVNHPNYGKKLKDRGGRSVKVTQYDIRGNFIKEWDSGTEAAKSLKINRGGIFSCCKGKYLQSGGFVWKYTNIASLIINC